MKVVCMLYNLILQKLQVCTLMNQSKRFSSATNPNEPVYSIDQSQATVFVCPVKKTMKCSFCYFGLCSVTFNTNGKIDFDISPFTRKKVFKYLSS